MTQEEAVQRIDAAIARQLSAWGPFASCRPERLGDTWIWAFDWIGFQVGKYIISPDPGRGERWVREVVYLDQFGKSTRGDKVMLRIVQDLEAALSPQERGERVSRDIEERRQEVARLRGLRWTAKEIARELQVGKRTIARDLDALGLTEPRKSGTRNGTK